MARQVVITLIEALSTSAINSDQYRRITSEFEEMWKRFERYRYDIDIILGNGRFFAGLNALSRRISQLRGLPARSKIDALWRLFCRFYIKKSKKFTNDILLRSNRLWSIKYWEYPWTITNSYLTRPMKILDVGSGWSLFPMYLARHGHQVDAIDIDEDQMTKISPFLARMQGAEINYRVQNVLDIDYQDNTFDRVFCISVLEHIEEEEACGKLVNYHSRNLDIKAVSEMLRVLKPTGLLLMTVDWSQNPANKRAYKLRDIYERVLYPYRYLLLNNKRPSVESNKYRSEITQLWKNKFPFLEGIDISSVGIILKKR